MWLIEQALTHGGPGRAFWWVEPTIQQAKTLGFDRVKTMLRPRTGYETNETERRLTLVNGASLWFKGADHPDSLYGDDVWAAVLDEATRCKEDAWAAVRSTLTKTRGPVRIIGNVRGRKNWAYQLARRAEGGAAEMHYAKLTAYDAVEGGILAAAEVEDARAALPERVFRELYLAEPSDDGGNPFGLQHIEACLGPLSTEPPVVWGWDLARAVDWTWGVALDAAGRVCRSERWQSSWEDTHRRIRELTGSCPAWVDSTGPGDAPFERLAREAANFRGYKFSAESKQHLMEGLAVAIQRHALTIPEGLLAQELRTFEFEVTRTAVHYTAPPGLHDDGVCALALAVYGARASSADTWLLVARERAAAATPAPAPTTPTVFGAGDAIPARCPGCGSDRFLRPTTVGHWQCLQCGASA